MTGTGNHVLCIEGGAYPFFGYYTFYVTGHALDERADMYLYVPTGISDGAIDSVSLNGDRFTDAVVGMGNYRNDADKVTGALMYVHGTDKIPVHLNPKYASVHVRFASSPTLEGLTAWNEDGVVMYKLPANWLPVTSIILRDLLGREACSGQIDSLHTGIPATQLAHGIYLLEVTHGGVRSIAKVLL